MDGPTTSAPASIPERTGVTAEVFRDEILPAARPVVMRGLATGWPIVQAGLDSPVALAEFCGGSIAAPR